MISGASDRDGVRPVPEVVHAAPAAGLSFTPCCDRTPQELPAYDRISFHGTEVTCNRLTAEDELLLTGARPPAATTASDQVLFDMAVSVRSLCGPRLSLRQAFQCVRTAVAELVPPGRPRDGWPAELLVEIAVRAGELAD